MQTAASSTDAVRLFSAVGEMKRWPNRKWLFLAAILGVVAVVSILALDSWWPRPSLRDRFDRVDAHMSEVDVLNVMGRPGDDRSDKIPQVSSYGEAWQMHSGEFRRREYWGMDVHTKLGLSGERILVWKTDAAVVVVEFDANDRVCGKMWLTD